jgi:hypothetical protein
LTESHDGYNGGRWLNPGTVSDDGEIDEIFAGGGADWVFLLGGSGPLDYLNDQDADDVISTW